eukprot:gene5832-15918_t
MRDAVWYRIQHSARARGARRAPPPPRSFIVKQMGDPPAAGAEADAEEADAQSGSGRAGAGGGSDDGGDGGEGNTERRGARAEDREWRAGESTTGD